VNIRWSPAEIVYSLADSGSRVLFVDDAFAPMLPALKEAYPDLATVIHAGDGPTPEGAHSHEQLIAEAEPVEDARRGGDELAGLFYTGGTTGFPRGVMLSHANLLTSAFGLVSTGFGFGPGARHLHAAPMFHPRSPPCSARTTTGRAAGCARQGARRHTPRSALSTSTTTKCLAARSERSWSAVGT
jgi:acyl-CoA synthetase (AMP-forming)/AMP-acid ligase II